MKIIIADTSFLVDCVMNKIDLFGELTRILDTTYTLAVLDRTMEELDVVIAKKREVGRAAKLARTILLAKKVTVLKTEGGHTDELLFYMADDQHIIATQDRELKRQLKVKKQPVIILRAGKKLELIGA